MMLLAAIAAGAVAAARAEYPVNYEGNVTLGAASGDFAPFYIASLDHGRNTQSLTSKIEAKVWRPMKMSDRFSYGFGVDLIGGYSSAVDYERFYPGSGWGTHGVRPATAWIQQLYGELKYRRVFLTVGMKETGSKMLNNRLTSGDIVESGNTRPIPGARAGFIGFVDIPFTRGAVQIAGEVAYGKFVDNGWLKDQYNYYNDHLTTGEWFNYKCIYFRTDPRQRFSVTAGLQAAAEFGGYEQFYDKGRFTQEFNYPATFKTFLKMLVPINDHEEGGFYTGNHLGSIDLKLRYRLRNGAEVMAYLSNPWEDGSGMGKMNGFDGLWGIEYKAADPNSVVSGAVIEYLDFTNQSGPIHLNPADFNGITITGHASGSDDYYNNRSHRAYANYGMGIGTPMVMSPAYNVNGYPSYMTNLTRGFHIAVEGRVSPVVTYRVKGGYRKAWGNGQFILPRPISLTAVMAEAEWKPASVKGLTLNGKVELDRGTMPGNSFGALVSVKYDGIFNLKK